MQRFTIPRDLYFGENALDHLKELKGKKAFIVIGSERLINDGTTGKIEAKLKEAGIESEIFSGVEADPSIATVMKGAARMIESNPDIIIGLGGGSPIDAAKAMWIFYEQPNLTFEAAAVPFSLPELRKKAIFVTIPTTSGTAAEVTSFSVIADTETGIKYPIADYNITPDVAILDATLVESMSKPLVANTGMDALTHAVEAYVSTAINPITDALAIKSIEMIGDYLENSYNNDNESRYEMHIAQSLAGMAFSNAILGIAHSIAHKISKKLKIPHGLINAIILTGVIEFNAKTAEKEYASIARALKVEGNTDKELVEGLVKKIAAMRTAMKMPHSLKEFGANEEDFKANLQVFAETSITDPCTGTNPREISVEEMKQLLMAVYYGEKVTF